MVTRRQTLAEGIDMMPIRVKQIYIAAPFFSHKQLAIVEEVEKLIHEVGLVYYSPRSDGILQSMTPAERIAQAPKIFKTNCVHVANADAVLALLDDHDTGTYWEMGFAYAIRRYNLQQHWYRIFAFTTQRPTLNVMLQQSVDAHACGLEELKTMLTSFAQGKPLIKPQPTENVV